MLAGPVVVTARIAARMEETDGLAKIPPKIAPVSMPLPIHPYQTTLLSILRLNIMGRENLTAWLGSCPLPPPERMFTYNYVLKTRLLLIAVAN